MRLRLGTSSVDHQRATDLYAVATLQQFSIDAAAIDIGTVAAAIVSNLMRAFVCPQHPSVVARDLGIPQADLIDRFAPDGSHRATDREVLTVIFAANNVERSHIQAAR